MLPETARSLALHYMSHTTDGWNGYSYDEVAEITTTVMVALLTGEMAMSEVTDLCDEYCF